MRAYIRIFMNLLMPISAIVTILAIAYFSVNYDFNKAMKLGVLSGVLIGFVISFIGALILLVMRVKKPSVQESDIGQEHTNVNTKPSSNNKTPVEQKLMLLMDKKVAFDVALFAIAEQNLGDIKTKETQEKCTITLRTQDQTIQIITTSLTRHTAQIILQASKNSEEIQKIISYIKEKEHSFLQY
jgi:mannitol-specific phosphotransferase system IIBC component